MPIKKKEESEDVFFEQRSASEVKVNLRKRMKEEEEKEQGKEPFIH